MYYAKSDIPCPLRVSNWQILPDGIRSERSSIRPYPSLSISASENKCKFLQIKSKSDSNSGFYVPDSFKNGQPAWTTYGRTSHIYWNGNKWEVLVGRANERKSIILSHGYNLKKNLLS